VKKGRTVSLLSASAAMAVRIRLCGDIEVEVDGERREGRLRGRHGRMLLVQLVLNRSRAVSRSELIDALWGEALPHDPSASLRAHLSRLRSTLGADAIEGTAQVRLRLPADAWVDVEEATSTLARAESAAADGRWPVCMREARAVARLTAGPLTPGIHAQWISAARAEVEQVCVRGLELVATSALALAQPDPAAAELAARTLIGRAPFRESGHRLLIRGLLASGEVAEGLRAFDAVRTLFRDELGIVPSAELRALHAALLDAAEVPDARQGRGWRLPHRLALPEPLVGRARERTAITARLETGELTLLEGEAGIGKTSLLAAVGAELEDQGWVVLYGRCEREAPIPYQPLVEALDGVVEALGQAEAESLARVAGPSIAPLLPALAMQDDQRSGAVTRELWQLYRAAARFLDRLAVERPVLLAVDDLHLTDRATLGLIGHLGEATGLRTAILATYRGTEAAVGGPLSELADRLRPGGGTIDLGGLGSEELGALLADRGAAIHPVSTVVDEVHAATDGNPLYALQLARHLMESRADAGNWREGDRVSLPAAVRELVGHRVARMPESVRRTLSVAAVIGRELDLDLLVRVARRPRIDVLGDLEVGLRAGVLRAAPRDSECLSFAHALIEGALYDDQLPARREECHRQVAEALEARGAGPAELARLAFHWAEAGSRSDPERVVEYSRRAAEHASSRLAFEGAAASYRRAVQAGEEVLGPAGLIELLLALSRTERQAGALQAARTAARRAADLARRTGDPARLTRAALSHAGARTTLAVDAFEMEHAREAAALLREAHHVLPGGDGLLRVRLLSELAQQRLAGLGVEERRSLAHEAALMAARLGDERGELLALQARTVPSLVVPEELDEAIAAADRAAVLAVELGDQSAECGVRRVLCGAHFVRGDIEAMDEQLRLMEQIVTALGDATHSLGLAVLRAGRARFAGRIEEARRIRDEAIGAALDPGSAAMAFGAQGWMPAWDDGRYEELIASIEGVVAKAPQALALHGLLALIHCEAGQLAEARERFELLAADGFPFAQDEFLLIGLTQTALACSYLGDSDRAATLHRMLAPYAALNGAIGEQALTNGPVTLSLGALEVTLGRHGEALRSLTRAEEQARAWGDPLSDAIAMAHRERLLVLAGRRVDGERSSAEAIEAGRSLGVGRVEVLTEGLREWWPEPAESPG